MKKLHQDTWVKLGLNIMYYRKQRGLTQMELAEACGEGLSRNYIQRIETAVSSCSLDTLIDIADALNISLSKLFEFKD